MSRFRLMLLGLSVALVVSAGASASASAVTMVWIKGGVELPKGEKVVAKSHGGPFTIKGTIAGIKVEIRCTRESGEGWVENPLGEKNGKGLLKMSFTECSTPKPPGKGCKVIEPLVIKAILEPFLKSGSPGVIFFRFTKEPEALVLGDVTFASCEDAALDGEYPLEGSIAAKSKNGEEEGSLEFTETSGSELKFAGNAATFVGTSILEF
jgi:hypothetical protein